MSLSITDLATLNFYQWEYQGRGYALFDTPVDNEVWYQEFHHVNKRAKVIDDGKTPSLWSKLIHGTTKKLSLPSSHQPITPEPVFLDEHDEFQLVGYTMSFTHGQDILPSVVVELLNMLTQTEHTVSFEVVGTEHRIEISMVCSNKDCSKVRSLIKAYFPNMILSEISPAMSHFDEHRTIAICDFGLEQEFMRSIHTTSSFSIDPLTPIVAVLDSLQKGSSAMLQVMFKGAHAPWSYDIPYAVSDGRGGSFFADAPDMVRYAQEKISEPLFGVVIRIAVQGQNNQKSQNIAQELIQAVVNMSRSSCNRLIPLSNKGYTYEDHVTNLFTRRSNRCGMILNAKELSTFVHYPNSSIVSSKLGVKGSTTKKVPQEYQEGTYLLGTNHHRGKSYRVMVTDTERLRHTHIIGSTGVGKSTLIANMMIEDMKHGNGCCLFDPHGDIVEDILLRIPKHRKKDVILIDPSRLDFPIGFNLLHATTEAEKMVLSSDLVGAFKRFATSWGDNMSAVLSQAINTFLESTKEGTLIELKRFLLEDDFRHDFLEYVHDPSIHYYWNNEYQFVRKGIAPLLTRIDTFLRPKIIRYMFAQQHGVDFRACIEEKKILLIKLSQGLIGEENSYLLGSLFLSKFNQVAQGRQQLSKHERHPYYIYLDEFQNFMTNSITSILSGARKYGLGLILAHQELAQIDDPKILNSVISNPYIRICFHSGDRDAKQLESGFSVFESNDLQSLRIGEAIIRIGSSQDDCNIATSRLSEPSDISDIIRQSVIEHSQTTYGKPRAEIEELLTELLPKTINRRTNKTEKKEEKKETQKVASKENPQQEDHIDTDTNQEQRKTVSEKEKQKLIQAEEVSRRNRDHQYLQRLIKKIGQERNFISTIEKETKEGGRIDITLEKEGIQIAFEISITNTAEYEVNNIKKCLRNGYLPVVMISKSKHHLDSIEKLAKEQLSKKDFSHVVFIQPHKIVEVLDSFNVNTQPRQEIIKGFRITTNIDTVSQQEGKGVREHLLRLLSKKK